MTGLLYACAVMATVAVPDVAKRVPLNMNAVAPSNTYEGKRLWKDQ
jgi:hypothetical protein